MQYYVYIYNISNFRIQNAYIGTVKINGVNHLLAAEPPRREAFTWIASKETLAQLPSAEQGEGRSIETNKYGYIWIWMDMDEYIWIWMDMDEYIWIWMDMDEYIWIWMDMDEYIWIWMDMDGYG